MRTAVLSLVVVAILAHAAAAVAGEARVPPRPGLVFGWYDPATDRFLPESAPSAVADTLAPAAGRVHGTLVVEVTVDLVSKVPADEEISVFVDGRVGNDATATGRSYNDYRTEGAARRVGATASYTAALPYGFRAADEKTMLTVWVDASTAVGTARPRTSQMLRVPLPRAGGRLVIPVRLAL